MRWVSAWMGLTDEFIHVVYTLRGKPAPLRSDDVQRDLQRLATWFEEHPAEAKAAWAYVCQEDT